MNKKLFQMIISTFFLLTCCITIEMPDISKTPGIYGDYSLLSEEEKKHVIYTENNLNLAFLKANKNIYAITGLQLKELLKTIDTAIVYFWSPHCSSVNCIPLSYLQYYCENINIELIVITEYYIDSFKQIESLTQHPLFSVNDKYYNSDLCNIYLKRFKQDILSKKQIKQIKSERLLVFCNGNFIGNYKRNLILN